MKCRGKSEGYSYPFHRDIICGEIIGILRIWDLIGISYPLLGYEINELDLSPDIIDQWSDYKENNKGYLNVKNKIWFM